MYHEITTEKTKEYVEKYPEIKKGLMEICHALKFKVLTHNEMQMKQNTFEEEKLFGLTSPSAERRLRNQLRFLLVDKYNIPAGCFYVKDGSNKEGKNVIAYCFIASFIEKERGRGTDRHTRDSINISALVKMLKRDYTNGRTPEDISTNLGHSLYSMVESRIGNAVNGRYHRISLSSETEKALVNMFFNQTTITDPDVLLDLHSAKKALENAAKDKQAFVEALEPFRKKVTFIVQHDECPMMVGTASVGPDDKTYLIHPEVNYYLSPDHLPEKYKQLLVDYKMWHINHEKPEIDKRIESKTAFKVLPISNDGYDTNLGIATNSNYNRSLGGAFEDFRMFVVPNLETDEQPNAN